MSQAQRPSPVTWTFSPSMIGRRQTTQHVPSTAARILASSSKGSAMAPRVARGGDRSVPRRSAKCRWHCGCLGSGHGDQRRVGTVAKSKRTPSDKGRRTPSDARRGKGATHYTPLHEKVWSALQAGKIPNRNPDRASRGPGVGARCPICDLGVAGDELVEIQFARDGGDIGLDKYDLHIRCYAAWEFERRKDDD